MCLGLERAGKHGLRRACRVLGRHRPSQRKVARTPDDWRRHYNAVRPRSPLGCRPPAPGATLWPAAQSRPAPPAIPPAEPTSIHQHSARITNWGLVKAAARASWTSRGLSVTELGLYNKGRRDEAVLPARPPPQPLKPHQVGLAPFDRGRADELPS